MGDTQVVPAAEFQALPLEFIISSPLVAAVRAQAVAAQTTLGFIKGMIDEDGKPIVVNFKIAQEKKAADGTVTNEAKTISAPLLSIAPIPHLRIDSLTINFKYAITQTVKSSSANEKGIEVDFKTGTALSLWASGGIKGNVSSKSSEESTMNRSGTLEITVHASEAPIPEGLAKILSMLSNTIQA